MNKAIIYARFSSHNQKEESIEGQIRICEDYAKRNNLTVIEQYIDRATTGTNDNRPDFQRMVKDSAKGHFDTVIVYKFDRFARDRYDSANYKRKLAQNGVRLVSAQENIPDSPEGIILESMLEGMAEYFSAELSQKVKRGKYEAAMKCKYAGGFIPLGYKVNPETKIFEVDEEKAPVIRQIFEKYVSGVKNRTIFGELNAMGFQTQRGVAFTNGTITGILRNPAYKGTYISGEVVIEDGFEPIVEKELWEKAQERLEKRKLSPASGKAKIPYLLSGKAYCGYCGQKMLGNGGTSANRKLWRYYSCKGRMKKTGCEKDHIRQEVLEDFVASSVVNFLSDKPTLEKIAADVEILAKKDSVQEEKLKLLTNQLKEVKTQKENYLKAIGQGIFAGGVQEKLVELDKQEIELGDEILRQSTTRPELTKEHVLFMLDELVSNVQSGGEICKEKLLQDFIHSVQVRDDVVVIRFNMYDSDEEIVSSAFTWGDCCSDSKSSALTDKSIPEQPQYTIIGGTVFLYCCF